MGRRGSCAECFAGPGESLCAGNNWKSFKFVSGESLDDYALSRVFYRNTRASCEKSYEIGVIVLLQVLEGEIIIDIFAIKKFFFFLGL